MLSADMTTLRWVGYTGITNILQCQRVAWFDGSWHGVTVRSPTPGKVYKMHDKESPFTPHHQLATSPVHPHSFTMSNHWEQPPPPTTKLGRYRQLAPLAGVHLSPICLGAMSIGDKWEKIGMGSMNKEQSFKLLDAYYDAGGNFIDTANN